MCIISADPAHGDIKPDHDGRSYIGERTDIMNVDDTTTMTAEESMSPKKTSKICYKLPLSLETLNIKNSKLLCDIMQVLCDPDNGLKTLILSDQYINDKRCSIDEIWGLLKNVRKLETLEMNRVNIKTIPFGSFSALRSLRNLHLQNNFLATLEFDLQTFALKSLDLSFNNVMYISKAFGDKLDEIADRTGLVVYLNNNSFLCDCERMEFMAWLRGSSAIYQRETQVICHDASEKTYNFSEICKLYEAFIYKCTVKEVTIGCAATFVMLYLILN